MNWTIIRLYTESTEMNGNYRRFLHLISAATTGLLQQIPVVGPVLQSVLAEMQAGKQHQALMEELQRLSRLLQAGASLASAKISAEQLEQGLSRIVDDEDNARLASTIFLAEAEAGNHLAGEAAPQRRFLYLAAKNYADAARTLEIAANLGFLWRSYHKDGGRKIPHVGEIRVGDLIVLAYRSPKQFRILLPLIVTEAGEHTQPINDAQFNCHRQHAPFVLADAWLTRILVKEGYGADPVFTDHTKRNLHSGLNVKPLLVNQVPQQAFPSPGQNTIWPYLRRKKGTTTYYLPPEVRNWIGQL